MVILLLAAAALGQSTATDRRPPPSGPAATMVVEPVAMAIAAFDADGDGRTTRAELAAGVARSVAMIEPRPATPLGYIGYSDWAERFLGDRNALPSPFEVDGNGDDRISLAEIQAAMVAAFDRFDRNHDGVVTRAELLTIRSGVGEREGPGGRHGKRPAG